MRCIIATGTRNSLHAYSKHPHEEELIFFFFFCWKKQVVTMINLQRVSVHASILSNSIELKILLSELRSPRTLEIMRIFFRIVDYP